MSPQISESVLWISVLYHQSVCDKNNHTVFSFSLGFYIPNSLLFGISVVFKNTPSSMFLDPFISATSVQCSLGIWNVKVFFFFTCFLRGEQVVWKKYMEVERWSGVTSVGCDMTAVYGCSNVTCFMCVGGQNKGSTKCFSIPGVTLPSTVLWGDVVLLFGGNKQTIENLWHLFNLNN